MISGGNNNVLVFDNGNFFLYIIKYDNTISTNVKFDQNFIYHSIKQKFFLTQHLQI